MRSDLLTVPAGTFLFRYRNAVFPLLILIAYAAAVPADETFGSETLEHAKDLLAFLFAFGGLAFRAMILVFPERYPAVVIGRGATGGLGALFRTPLYLAHFLVLIGIFLMHGNTYVVLFGLAACAIMFHCMLVARAGISEAAAVPQAALPVRTGFRNRMRRLAAREWFTVAVTLGLLILTEVYEHLPTQETASLQTFLLILSALLMAASAIALHLQSSGGGTEPAPANPDTRGILVDKRVGTVDFFENALSFGRLESILHATLDAASLGRGDRLVDIGCGSGRLAIAAARLFGGDGAIDALGIDATPGMILLARQNAQAARSRARFQIGVAERLPLGDESVNAVTSSYFFHHLPPEVKAEALREMWRVLAPGGRLVITDYGRPRGFLGYLASFPMRFNFYEYTRPQLRGELGRIIEREGLGPAEVVDTFLGYITVLRLVKPLRSGDSHSYPLAATRDDPGRRAARSPTEPALAEAAPPVFGKMVLRAVISLMIVAVGFAFVAIAFSGEDFGATVRAIDGSTILMLVGLATFNYLARTLRWLLLFRTVRKNSSGKNSGALPLHGLVYLGGFAFTLTPGRAGEAVRAWMAKRSFGLPPAAGVSLVIADRFYDAVALAVILAVTAAILSGSMSVPLTAVCVLAAATLAIAWLAGAPGVWARIAGARPWLARPAAAVQRMIGHLSTVSRPRQMPVFTLPSLAGWTVQGLAPALILDDFGIALGATEAISIFALATLVGGASFLPGGLGGFELTMIGLLTATGVDPGTATIATLALRLTTLWFGVSLGLAALLAWLALPKRIAQPAFQT